MIYVYNPQGSNLKIESKYQGEENMSCSFMFLKYNIINILLFCQILTSLTSSKSVAHTLQLNEKNIPNDNRFLK